MPKCKPTTILADDFEVLKISNNSRLEILCDEDEADFKYHIIFNYLNLIMVLIILE